MKYFGTDGIRGKAEMFSTDFLKAVVWGLVGYAEQKLDKTDFKVLIGGDTRESTEWILADLEKCLESLGVEYGNVGVLPTPAINDVFFEMGFDFAIDVTASHNPYTDNGIKIFERGEKFGVKLSEAGKSAIERAIENPVDYYLVEPELREDLHLEAVKIYKEKIEKYVGELELGGMRVGLDCANGATSILAKLLFENFGAEVFVINEKAEFGQTINDNCGSTHIEKLQKMVQEKGLDCGAAFDGDGDRCLMVDKNGELVDGDQMLAILAEELGEKKVVATVMANQGLYNWAKESGIKIETTDVGDHNVFLKMQKDNIRLGGEQSGHIILPSEAMGDGILTALMMLKTLCANGCELADLASTVKRLPQVMINIPATAEEKVEILGRTDIIDEYEEKLKAENGRLLVRPSGTENLVRVTLWGENEVKIKTLGEELCQKLKS